MRATYLGWEKAVFAEFGRNLYRSPAALTVLPKIHRATAGGKCVEEELRASVAEGQSASTAPSVGRTGARANNNLEAYFFHQLNYCN